VKISVVIPTIGRHSLAAAIESAVWADELIVVSDGCAGARWVLGELHLPGPYLVYVEIPRFGHQGLPRNTGHRLVSGDYVGFLDDDDAYVEGAGPIIRQGIEQAPGKAHTFKMRKMAGREQHVGSPCTFIPMADCVPGDWWRQKNRGVDTNVFQWRARDTFGEVFHPEVIVQLRPHVVGVD